MQLRRVINKFRMIELGPSPFKSQKKALSLGDIVKIRKDGRFYGQCELWGKVTTILCREPLLYKVIFQNGYENNYPVEELDVLKTGDKVVINEKGDEHYIYTKFGSEGEITTFLKNGRVNIKFYKITGEYPVPNTFPIKATDVDLVENLNKEKAKAEKKQTDLQADIYFTLCGLLEKSFKNQ